MINAWLLQYYSLGVWLTTGFDTRRRKPASLDKLVPFINTAITGQLVFAYVSLYFLLDGKALSENIMIGSILFVGAGVMIGLLPRLEARAKRERLPMLFLKLSRGKRLWYACSGLVLFWATFFSIFVVAASLD